MRAMVLRRGKTPLELTDVPPPEPESGRLLVRVDCCAVCRTDLHVVDGELADPKLLLVIGHQIAGTVVDSRADANDALRDLRSGELTGAAIVEIDR